MVRDDSTFVLDEDDLRGAERAAFEPPFPFLVRSRPKRSIEELLDLLFITG
jgi:hypothetical protein